MKHLPTIATSIISAALALFAYNASAQNSRGLENIVPRKQAKLPDGHIYLPHERLTIMKDISNDQKRIHIEISNEITPEREIQVFLKQDTAELEDLATGIYELFFTGSSLALTNKQTSKKIVFELNDESPHSNSSKLHGNADQVLNAIGIAAYFKTCPRPQ
ncbi:hypothetical protein LZD49_05715 [Dyadobacter sp. CY261]|uniref:hypothetical protein n=1 Tax=Dyadobacter sp. CY261 TaxID=2907203 RepID=UPI001F159D1E|nr:hypothetical protein [Dyadobacter sp. CY261]MCF0069958.1 hypothetical protein [Dyadobacter sp. CY261]